MNVVINGKYAQGPSVNSGLAWGGVGMAVQLCLRRMMNSGCIIPIWTGIILGSFKTYLFDNCLMFF